MQLSTALLPGLLLGLALPSLARADLPPSPDYVERCTVEAQGPGQECVACGDAYHGDVDACEKKHAVAGLTRRCRTAGASVWTEVWCKPSPAAPAPAPAPVTPPEAGEAKAPAAPQSGAKDVPPKPAGGCSIVAAGAGGLAGSAWLLAVLGFAGARRRRRR